MKDNKVLEDLGFVKRGKNRVKVFKALYKPQNPSTIGKMTGIGLMMASRSLRDLTNRSLVECVNPDWKVGRIYKLTKKGEKLLEYFKEKD